MRSRHRWECGTERDYREIDLEYVDLISQVKKTFQLGFLLRKNGEGNRDFLTRRLTFKLSKSIATCS
jgi:hypothetical protein